MQNRIPGMDLFYQYTQPEATRLRSLIAGIQNLTIKDLSGATVTVGEEKRLAPYVPSVNDPVDVIKQKLKRFQDEYNVLLEEQQNTLKEQGFKPVTVKTEFEETETQLTPAQQEAMDWLEANPNHPKAPQVRAKLGM
jgi:hypothetical protein